MELLRKYNTATTIYFPLISVGTANFITSATHAAGDTQIIKDGGAAANTTNAFAHEGNGIYSLALTATEMQAAKIQVTVIDQGTKAYSDQAIILATYGNASAELVFDLSVATQKVDVDTIKTNPVVNAGTVTFPTGATLASTTNITAGTITTTTNLTNLPTIPANWITAAGINADAFTAAKFAADVGTEIATAVWASGTRVLTAGTNIALAKGTGVTGFNDLDAAGVATAVWNAATASYGTAGTYGLLVETNLDAAVTSRMATYTQPSGFLAATFPTGTIANTTNITAGTITTATNVTTVNGLAANVITAAATAADFTTEIQTGLATASALSTLQTTANDILTDTAEIGVAGAGLTNINLPNQTMDIVGNITGNLSGSVGSVTGAVGSVTGAVGSVTGLTNATIADQVWDEVLSGHLTAGSTGNALNAAGAAGDPWTTSLPGAYGAGSAGYIIGTNIDALISSRMATYTQPTGFLAATFPTGTIANTTNITAGTITTATNVTTVNGLAANVITAAATAADFGTEVGTAVWSSATRILTAGTNIALAKGTGVTGFNDLSAAQVNAEVDTALADVGVTLTVTGRIDAAISSRLASASYTAPDNASIAAILVDTAEIGAAGAGLTALASATNLATVDTVVDGIKVKTDSLTFTVAGQVDANIQYVNDIAVTGDGQTGTEWGPV
jgi:hypothetical protein